jgi:hypothetical protein
MFMEQSMANFIALTHLINNKPAPLYVNVDQICRVVDSVGGGPGYATDISLSQGQVFVRETVAQVMQIINGQKAPAMAAAASFVPMSPMGARAARAPRAAAKPRRAAAGAGAHRRTRAKRK